MTDVPTLAGDTTISTMIGIYYDHVFLKRLEANLVYDKFGEQRPLPENQGNTIYWHQMLNPTTGYSLGDGSTPAASAVSARKVSAQLSYIADLRAVSDQVDMTAVCPVVEETVNALGYGAALTKDNFISDAIGYASSPSTGLPGSPSALLPSIFSRGFPVMEGNSGTVYWPSAAAGGVTTTLQNGYFSTIAAISHIRKCVTHLKRMNAMPFEDGNFRAVVHPLVSDHIRQDTTFPTWMAYTNREAALDKGRLGVIEKVYFEESAQAMKVNFPASSWSAVYVAGAGTIIGTLIHGMQAYGVTKLGGRDAKVKVIPTDSIDKSDPLGQRAYVGYKMQIAAAVLNPSAGIILTWYASSQTY